jgi:hypothetical protein
LVIIKPALHGEFNFMVIWTNIWEYINEEFLNVTRDEIDKAFIEWLNA